jgi:hypothetical protein
MDIKVAHTTQAAAAPTRNCYQAAAHLSRVALLAVEAQRLEGAATCKQHAAAAPLQRLLKAALALAGGVAQREDDRLGIVLTHRLNNLLRECVVDGANTD